MLYGFSISQVIFIGNLEGEIYTLNGLYLILEWVN